MARAQPLTPPSQRAPWGWAVTGFVLGLLVAVACFAPARWLAAAVSQASDGRVLLQAARGSIWNGSAQLVVTGGQGSQDAAALPSRLSWQLRPAAGGLRLLLSAPCCLPQPLALGLQPQWAGGVVRVEDGPPLAPSQPSRWPASLLAGLGTPWNTLQVEGELQLSTRGLVLRWTNGRLQVEGQVELIAQRMASRLSTLRPMGSYRLTLSGGTAPTLRLDTLEGDLRLSGSGQWVGSRLRFAGEASAAPEREAALANLLNIIGQRRGPRSLITIG